MDTVKQKSIYLLLVAVLSGCSILPKQTYTPVKRYDFGVLSLSAIEDGRGSDKLDVVLRGAHPAKLVYRVGANQVEQMEYLRWAQALDRLIHNYLAQTLSPSVEHLQVTVYSWEYNIASQKVTAHYSVKTATLQKVLRHEVHLTRSFQDGVAEAFAVLMAGVAKQIAAEVGREQL